MNDVIRGTDSFPVSETRRPQKLKPRSAQSKQRKRWAFKDDSHQFISSLVHSIPGSLELFRYYLLLVKYEGDYSGSKLEERIISLAQKNTLVAIIKNKEQKFNLIPKLQRLERIKAGKRIIEIYKKLSADAQDPGTWRTQ